MRYAPRDYVLTGWYCKQDGTIRKKVAQEEKFWL